MLTRLGDIPHLFSKTMVTLCVVSGIACCVWAFRILSRTEQDPSALLGVALAFFGGELAMMFAKTALSKAKSNNKEDSYD